MKRFSFIAVLMVLPILTGCCNFRRCMCEKKDPYATQLPAAPGQPGCGCN